MFEHRELYRASHGSTVRGSVMFPEPQQYARAKFQRKSGARNYSVLGLGLRPKQCRIWNFTLHSSFFFARSNFGEAMGKPRFEILKSL